MDDVLNVRNIRYEDISKPNPRQYYTVGMEAYLNRQSIRDYLPLDKHINVLAHFLNLHPEIGTQIVPAFRYWWILKVTNINLDE